MSDYYFSLDIIGDNFAISYWLSPECHVIKDNLLQSYKKISPLATCLGDKMTPAMEDVDKWENLSDCLTSRPLLEIHAKWQIDNRVFSFGGKQRELKVWRGKTAPHRERVGAFCIRSFHFQTMFNYQLEGMKHAGQITVEAGHNKPKRQVGYHLCR